MPEFVGSVAVPLVADSLVCSPTTAVSSATGIENEAIWQILRHAGCDVGQGYFMSKPIPAPQLGQWISAWRPPQVEDMSRRPARPLYAVR